MKHVCALLLVLLSISGLALAQPPEGCLDPTPGTMLPLGLKVREFLPATKELPALLFLGAGTVVTDHSTEEGMNINYDAPMVLAVKDGEISSFVYAKPCHYWDNIAVCDEDRAELFGFIFHGYGDSGAWVEVVHTTDGGLTWKTGGTLQKTSSHADDLVWAESTAKGSCTVVFERNDPAGANKYYQYSTTDGAESWTPSERPECAECKDKPKHKDMTLAEALTKALGTGKKTKH